MNHFEFCGIEARMEDYLDNRTIRQFHKLNDDQFIVAVGKECFFYQISYKRGV